MITFSDRPASPGEFIGLRVAAGLSGFGPEAAAIALQNTLYGCWLRDEGGVLIGMARLTGDGGCFAFVTDVAVHPAHQGQGFGLKLMTRLMEWSDANLPSGTILSLIADEGAERLYCKVGFEMRQGMLRRVP